jgi:hypothetical protein
MMRTQSLPAILVAVTLALPAATAAQTATQSPLRSPDVIFVPTPPEVVAAMLKVASRSRL